ncbi:tail fiber protein [Roseivivax marinus]|uniref:Tail fiber protein n=1 Tax=Roseivivax marinus TaxID=1379903 RepID=W4HP90_9RHOB|nr:host specificity factor TipJ family phage tail protein [Roseivivax marinus]ETW14248.1 tail fiber protein [Roseivivax marinus]
MLDDTLIRTGAQEHPLVASRRDVRAFAGQTVAQIVHGAALDPARGLPQVTLWRDGRSWTVPMDQWGRVRPRAGATVDIHYDTQGAAIAAVATAALSASAGSIATFLLPGLTGLGLTLATTAITVVGGLLINSLIAPPEPGGGNDDPNYAITGTGNVAAKYRPVPLVCGRHRMFPVKSAAGYSETVNGDIYWRGRYCFGWGKVGLEDLRIGNTPITEFDNVEIEFLNVDKDYTLAHTPGLDALTQLKLSEDQAPGAILREVTETYVFEPQSVAGRVTLRVAPNDKLPGYGYNFRVDTREAGGSWVAGTTYSGQTAPVTWTSPAFADGVDRTFRVILTAIQEPPEGQEVAPILALVHRPSISVTRATAEYQPGYAIKSWRYGAERMSLYPGDVSEEQFNVLLEETTPVVRLTTNDAASAAIDISYPQGLYDSDDGETQSHEANFAFRYQRVGDTAWTDAGTERHEAVAQTLIRFTKTIAFPTPGEYRVEVTRTDPIDTDSGDQNRGYLTAIRSFANTRLPSHNRVAEIAVRIKATDQLNGQIDSLNAIVQQFAPTWTGTGWGPQEPVRHPAWVFAELLRGPHLRRPVEDTKIDRNALKAWADDEPHWTFDYVFDTDSRVADALKLVAAAGRAKPHLADLRYSVIRDGADGPIRQVFTQRNSWGFKGSLAFSREIHGFRVQFRSERLEWEQDEITVYLDGYDETNATEFETLELPGVVITENETHRGNPYRLARYHLANVILRPETYEWQADFEHLAVTRGDKVQLVHDVPQIGVGAARIREVQTTPEGALTGLVLDDVFPGAGGIDFRLTVRRADGTRISFSAENGDTIDHLWEPTQAVSGAGIAAGDLVAIEKTTQETMEVLITGIFQEDDLAARLVGVPAAPAVLTADTEAIPDYDPIITRLPDRYGPPQPVPTRVFSDAASATKARDGVLRVRIGVELQQYEGPPGVWLRLRWSDPLRGGWIEGARVLPAATLFTAEVPEGLPMAVEVRAEDGDGNHRGWVRAGEVNGSPGALPAAPGAWAGTPGIRDVIITGTRPADVRGWNVYEAQAEAGPYQFLTFIDTIHAAFQPSPGYTWFRLAAVNHSGQEGARGAPFQIVPTGVRAEDLSEALNEKINAGFDRHDATLEEAEGTIAELRDAAIAAYGDYDLLAGRPSLLSQIDDYLVPTQGRLEDQIDAAAENVTWAINSFAQTNQVIADAGIVVDPNTGQVTIAGFHSLDGRVGDAEIRLDAAETGINLRATFAEVNQAISEAMLDPTQVPIIYDLELRVSSVEADLDAAEGAITLKADTAIVSGIDSRLISAEADIDSLEGTITLKADSADLTDVQSRLTLAEVQIDTLDGANITQTVQDTRRQTEEIDASAFNSFNDLWQGMKDREALREGVALAQSEIYASVGEQFEAEAGAREVIAVRVDQAAAAIETERRTRVAEDAAIAESLVSLEAELRGDSATAISNLSALVEQQGDTITAQSQDIAQLQASITSTQSDVSGNADALSALSGTVTQQGNSLTAQAQDITALEATLDDVDGLLGSSSAFNGLSATVSDQGGEITSLSSDLTTLAGRVGDAEGSISNLAATRVTASGAVSAVENRISASYGSLTALAEAATFAKATADGIASGYFLKLNGSNILEALSVDDGSGVSTSIKLDADLVRITGITQMTTAVLNELFAANVVTDRLTVTEGMIVSGRYLQKELISTMSSANSVGSQETILSLSVPAGPQRFATINVGFSVKSNFTDFKNVNWKLFADLQGDGQVQIAGGNVQARPSGNAGKDWVSASAFDARPYTNKSVVLTLVVESTNGSATFDNGVIQMVQTSRT